MGRTPDDHSKQAGNTQTRRRGAELEAAILDAAWEQLIAEGYEHFTIDTVAARARTSKPVLYRRWKTREDLLRATVRHRGAADPPAIPDTGTLRGDLLALLTHANTTRNPMAALVSSMLGSYYNQTGPTPAELRDAFLSQRGSVVEAGRQPRRRARGDRPGPAHPPDHRSPLRPVPQRNDDDAQARPRPRPAPDRRRHLHPPRLHTATSPLTRRCLRSPSSVARAASPAATPRPAFCESTRPGPGRSAHLPSKDAPAPMRL